MQATVIGYLRKSPGLTRLEIAEGVQLPKMTIANGLEKLVAGGLVIADPPRDETMRGQQIRYLVDDAKVTEMVMRLEQVLGEYGCTRVGISRDGIRSRRSLARCGGLGRRRGPLRSSVRFSARFHRSVHGVVGEVGFITGWIVRSCGDEDFTDAADAVGADASFIG